MNYPSNQTANFLKNFFFIEIVRTGFIHETGTLATTKCKISGGIDSIHTNKGKESCLFV